MRDGTLTPTMPSEVVIAGRVYALVETRLRETLGNCDNTNQILQVDGGQHEFSKKDTVLHEVLHAIDDAIQSELSERQVRSVTTALLDMMRRNPAFMNWLVS